MPQKDQQDDCPTADAAILHAPPGLNTPPATPPYSNAQTLTVDLGQGLNALTLGIQNLSDPAAAVLRAPLTVPANLDITFNITSANGNFSQSFRLAPLVPPGQAWFETFRNRFDGPGQAAFNVVNQSPYQLAVSLRATPTSCMKARR